MASIRRKQRLTKTPAIAITTLTQRTLLNIITTATTPHVHIDDHGTDQAEALAAVEEARRKQEQEQAAANAAEEALLNEEAGEGGEGEDGDGDDPAPDDE